MGMREGEDGRDGEGNPPVLESDAQLLPEQTQTDWKDGRQAGWATAPGSRSSSRRTTVQAWRSSEQVPGHWSTLSCQMQDNGSSPRSSSVEIVPTETHRQAR